MTKKRNIGQEILEGLRAVKRGKGRRIEVKLPDNVQAIRERTGLSQSAFAALLGVSTRTLQEWEQGRRQPAGPARAASRGGSSSAGAAGMMVAGFLFSSGAGGDLLVTQGGGIS